MNIPSHPLPLGAYARVAVVGTNRRRLLLTSLLACGRPHELVSLAALQDDPVGFADADVIFLTEPVKVRGPGDPSSALWGERVVVCAQEHQPDGTNSAPPDRSDLKILTDQLQAARVVGAFGAFSDHHLERMGLGACDSDVPVVGDDREAADLVEALIDAVPGLTAVYSGPSRNAMAVEGLASVLRVVASSHGGPVGFRMTQNGLRFLR